MTIIDKTELLKMRLMLPAKGYKLLKNRKNARLCRLRKKTAIQTVTSSFSELEQENVKMQRYIQKCLDRLQKVEQRIKAKKLLKGATKSFDASATPSVAISNPASSETSQPK